MCFYSADDEFFLYPRSLLPRSKRCEWSGLGFRQIMLENTGIQASSDTSRQDGVGKYPGYEREKMDELYAHMDGAEYGVEG